MRLPSHPSINVEIHGELVPIDRDIAPLVIAFNKLDDIATLESCQDVLSGPTLGPLPWVLPPPDIARLSAQVIFEFRPGNSRQHLLPRITKVARLVGGRVTKMTSLDAYVFQCEPEEVVTAASLITATMLEK